MKGYVMKHQLCQAERAQWPTWLLSFKPHRNDRVEGIKKEDKRIKDAQQNSNL